VRPEKARRAEPGPDGNAANARSERCRNGRDCCATDGCAGGVGYSGALIRICSGQPLLPRRELATGAREAGEQMRSEATALLARCAEPMADDRKPPGRAPPPHTRCARSTRKPPPTAHTGNGGLGAAGASRGLVLRTLPRAPAVTKPESTRTPRPGAARAATAVRARPVGSTGAAGCDRARSVGATARGVHGRPHTGGVRSRRARDQRPHGGRGSAGRDARRDQR